MSEKKLGMQVCAIVKGGGRNVEVAVQDFKDRYYHWEGDPIMKPKKKDLEVVDAGNHIEIWEKK